MQIYHMLVLTVVGPLLAMSSQRGLLRLSFLEEAYRYHSEVSRLSQQFSDDATLIEDLETFLPLINQLGEYFCGQRKKFDLPIDLHGTDFQLAVWKLLQTIPFGKLRTYQRVARDIGQTNAARAVGQAAGQNPLPIIVPCHRVIGSDGRLVGFGGGKTLKAQMLRLEGHTMGPSERIVAPQLF